MLMLVNDTLNVNMCEKPTLGTSQCSTSFIERNGRAYGNYWYTSVCLPLKGPW